MTMALNPRILAALMQQQPQIGGQTGGQTNVFPIQQPQIIPERFPVAQPINRPLITPQVQPQTLSERFPIAPQRSRLEGFGLERFGRQGAIKSSLEEQAKQYKTAEEFGRESQKGNVIVNVPIDKISGLEPQPMPKPTAKRDIIEPVEIVVTDQGDYILEAGNHRYHQAVFNNDKTIPAKIRLEKQALTDIFNKAKGKQ